ncbi:conserved domain protein [Peptoniphilus sp. ING2-D1G]|nr:conserved domain protein [Peptoniphilus sp. ING2-D1G]
MREQANRHANNFFEDFKKNIAGETNVCKMAKVVKFYPETMKVDVMPLPSEDNAMIINVPVATVRSKDFLIYYPLKADDIVILIFADNDTDNILLGEDSIETERGHDVSDCICIGGITLLNDSLSIDDPDSLIIQNISNTAKIIVKENGDIDIKCKHFKVEAERIDLN